MLISDMISLLETKLVYLGIQRVSATSIGDVDQVLALDNQISECQNTLNKLRAAAA